MSEENPKLFISYSWSSPEHEAWVVSLATELRESGVDVILDKWDLKEGHDAFAFMEKMVTDPEIKKVAIICDKVYSEKANDRKGGVGTETQIISPEVYQKEDQNKFVAIVAEKNDDGQAYLPAYYKSRIYIDLSESDLYSTNFEQLLRWIFDKPLFVKPKIGKKPTFLSDENPILLGTTSKYKRALEAVRNNREYSKGAIAEYFETLVLNLYIRDCLDCTRENKYQDWWPETLLYIGRHSGVFEIFARAQSKEYFDRIKGIFDIATKDDLIPLFNLFKENKLRVPSWEWTSFCPAALIGFDNLASRP